jgi:hypothetical protein
MKLGYQGRKDVVALDYIINQHPNRDAILGANSDWKLEVP